MAASAQAIHSLLAGAEIFATKLFGSKEAISALDESTASASLNFQYTLSQKKVRDLSDASGGTAATWLERQLGMAVFATFWHILRRQQ